MNYETALYILTALVAVYIIRKVFMRLRLSRAKHPSLRGHVKWLRRITRLIPYFEYGDNYFFCSDGATESIAKKRRQGINNLRQLIRKKFPATVLFSASLENSLSDVRFTSAHKVPFPYRRYLHKELKLGSIVEETNGVKVKDIDGNWSYDLSGSYGVNVFGYDFYKDCIDRGSEKVKILGPVLGSYHPLIRKNVDKLRTVSGLDEVSFHMSGTEAVMQAVRLARYHTGKTHLVRLCGAYHGWWDGVQPGIGNQRKTNDVYTLSDLSKATLKVLTTRNDIACVLINPLQALHPNSDAPSDATLINSTREANFNRGTYTKWLKNIRDICTRNNIVLIFDEVFTGFRLAHRGAQEYFNVQADMVTYGKTLGGGLPVGVVCGKSHLMKRFKDDAPVNISFARGTFNSHPYVMGAMNEFLNRIEEPDIQQLYHEADNLWNNRVARLNQRMEQKSIPIRIANLHSILTVLYTLPGRYNWMFQFYLKAEGLHLSWIGSGRMIMSLNYSEQDFNAIIDRFVLAAENMNTDGWWWQSPQLTNKAIKRMMLRDMVYARFPMLGNIMRGSVQECVRELTEEVHRG